MRRSGAVAQRFLTRMPGAVRAAVNRAARFDAVAEDAAAAVCAARRELLDRAFEAVESVRGAAGDTHREGLVVLVAADFTALHKNLLSGGATLAGVALRFVLLLGLLPAPLDALLQERHEIDHIGAFLGLLLFLRFGEHLRLAGFHLVLDALEEILAVGVVILL